MIGVLGGFGLEVPSKHMGRLVVVQSLLRQRYRSLFFVPSNCEWLSSEKRGLSAFSTYLAKKHGSFNMIGLKNNGKEGAERTDGKSKKVALLLRHRHRFE